MRTAILLMVVTLRAGTFTAQAAIERLDGSTILPGAIDAAVLHLMKAAEVPGEGITIFNGGRVAYSKAYGFRDK